MKEFKSEDMVVYEPDRGVRTQDSCASVGERVVAQPPTFLSMRELDAVTPLIRSAFEARLATLNETISPINSLAAYYYDDSNHGDLEEVSRGETAVVFSLGDTPVGSSHRSFLAKTISIYDGKMSHEKGRPLLLGRAVSGDTVDRFLDPIAETCKCLAELGISGVTFQRQLFFQSLDSGGLFFYHIGEDLSHGGRFEVLDAANVSDFSSLPGGTPLRRELDEYVTFLSGFHNNRESKYSLVVKGHHFPPLASGESLVTPDAKYAVERMFFVVVDRDAGRSRLVAGDLDHVLLRNEVRFLPLWEAAQDAAEAELDTKRT